MKPSPSHSRIARFWPLQLMGWGLYLGINFLCSISKLNELDFDAFRGVFLFSGFLASFPMYWLCHTLWKRKVELRLAVGICMVVAFPLGMLCAFSAFQCALMLGQHKPFRLGDVIAASPSGCYVLISWVAFYFGIKHYLALEEKHRQLIATELMAKEAQLQALRYQLQPHFLFNTMNAISTLVLNDQPHAATEMIGKLAQLLRSTLDAPELHQISLADELATTEEYLAIEAIRFGDRLTVRWDVDDALANVLVPRLILQPLVENAVRHGIARRVNGGYILVRTYRQGERLCVVIENEPPEESAAILLDGVARPGGIGLQNVRQRLEKMYGDEGTMHTSTNARGNFEVSFTVPVEYGPPSASYKLSMAVDEA